MISGVFVRTCLGEEVVHGGAGVDMSMLVYACTCLHGGVE